MEPFSEKASDGRLLLFICMVLGSLIANALLLRYESEVVPRCLFRMKPGGNPVISCVNTPTVS